MKSLIWLTECILLDSGMRCGANPARDIENVRRRTEHEGESFLTITLPAFGSAFDRALADGSLEPYSTPSFRWHRRGLPEFLRGFLLQVFRTDGRLLPEPSHEAILCIRQICLLHKKVLRPCEDRRIAAALRKFKECDDGLEVPFTASQEDLSRFSRVSAIVWSDLVSSCPFGVPYDELVPKHGPGSTRERIHGNAKYVFKRWHTRLEEQLPFTEFAVASLRNIGDDDCPLRDVEFVEPTDEEPVRVIFVPKTLKTPRVIAIEPVCMQYMQQAILGWLVPRIERGRYTAGKVNFSDQSINGRIALSASVCSSYATIDLSEASDRVSLPLIELMLESVPGLRDQILACRSTRAELPDGDVLTLRKFASMGSALCFPMEAMAFFLIAITSRLNRAQLPITPRNVRQASSAVFVYGDDIIVPTDEAPSVCSLLEAFSLKVNTDKSFWTGKFRESCGVDAYDGTNVTPTYVRREQPARRQDAEALVSWTAMANQFYLKGFWGSARRVRLVVEKILGRLPYLGATAHGLCWTSLQGFVHHNRWNKDLMRFETRTWVPTSSKRNDPLGDDSALMKCFGLIGLATSDSSHLQQTVVRGRLTLKSRWVPSL